MSTKKRILFIHPDLGIGGAERLVVDAAVGLQNRGHTVIVYTSHRDLNHCFDEARNGTLRVHVAGDSLFPANIGGKFSIFCAILRQLHLSFSLIYSGELRNYDCIFIDQLSASIPLFRLFASRITILFYCHFPDYLLASHKSYIKSLYRIPFDWIEGYTTGLAHTIVVNSRFTRSVFSDAFPRITRQPTVVYPCVNISDDKVGIIDDDNVGLFENDGKNIVLSINRFERKKNIDLAVKAYALLTEQERTSLRLVIAGGYDNRVKENICYHNELIALCDTFRLKHFTCSNFISALSVPSNTDVLFLLSIPDRLKTHLLLKSSLLLYTPENEHFGIVPLEALFSGIPVLAHKSGGPLETIQEGATGWLRLGVPSEWTQVIRMALFGMSVKERINMGIRGKKSVLHNFSKEKMAERLEKELESLQPQAVNGVRWILYGLIILIMSILAVMVL